MPLVTLVRGALRRVGALPYKYLVAGVFVFGLFMDMMDSTVVNVALPSLSRDFHASTAAVEWTVTGYLLSLAVFIPAAGFLSDRFGTKRTYLLAMSLFVLASGACGQARSLQELVAFRLLQGVGGGMMTPVGTAMLSREFPGVERAKASAIMSIPMVLAPTFGPVLGGYLTEYVSWRWIFYVNLPAGVLGLVAGAWLLREHREDYAQGRFDVPGLLTGSLGTASLLYALSMAGEAGWGARNVLLFGGAGLALLAAFTAVELTTPHPVLDLRLFTRQLFASSNVMMAPAFGAFGGFALLLTLFLQELHGYSPLQAGLIQAPSTLGMAASLPFASRLFPRIGPRRMLLAGFGLAALTLVPFVWITLDTPPLVITALLTLRGIPFAFSIVAVQTTMYGPLESAKQGAASSIYSTLRQVAGSFGVAFIITLMISRTAAHQAALTASHATLPASQLALRAAVAGYHDAFLVCVVLLFLPFAIAWFTVNDRAATEALQARFRTLEPAQGAAAGPAAPVAQPGDELLVEPV